MILKKRPVSIASISREKEEQHEGCQVTLEGDKETFILTCYLFQNGEQAWLFGTGRYAGDEIDFANLTVTSGTGYGNNFDADEVERVTWGSAGMVWSDCNNAELILVPQIAGFTPFTVDVTKVTPSNCNGQAPTLEFSDCNDAVATASPSPGQSGFTDLQLNVSKVVAGNCEPAPDMVSTHHQLGREIRFSSRSGVSSMRGYLRPGQCCGVRATLSSN